MNIDPLININKDLKNFEKLVILITGSEKSGKSSFIECLSKSCNFNFIETKKKTFYTKYIYKYTSDINDNYNFLNSILNKFSKIDKVSILLEFREIDSCELNTDYKMCLSFFENAYFALIITDFSDRNSFVEAQLWKEKISSLTVLPNYLPLPVYLILNKIDQLIDTEFDNNLHNAYSFKDNYTNLYNENSRDNLSKVNDKSLFNTANNKCINNYNLDIDNNYEHNSNEIKKLNYLNLNSNISIEYIYEVLCTAIKQDKNFNYATKMFVENNQINDAFLCSNKISSINCDKIKQNIKGRTILKCYYTFKEITYTINIYLDIMYRVFEMLDSLGLIKDILIINVNNKDKLLIENSINTNKFKCNIF